MGLLYLLAAVATFIVSLTAISNRLGVRGKPIAADNTAIAVAIVACSCMALAWPVAGLLLLGFGLIFIVAALLTMEMSIIVKVIAVPALVLIAVRVAFILVPWVCKAQAHIFLSVGEAFQSLPSWLRWGG